MAMASNLIAMASNLVAMASNLLDGQHSHNDNNTVFALCIDVHIRTKLVRDCLK